MRENDLLQCGHECGRSPVTEESGYENYPERTEREIMYKMLRPGLTITEVDLSVCVH